MCVFELCKWNTKRDIITFLKAIKYARSSNFYNWIYSKYVQYYLLFADMYVWRVWCVCLIFVFYSFIIMIEEICERQVTQKIKIWLKQIFFVIQTKIKIIDNKHFMVVKLRGTCSFFFVFVIGCSLKMKWNNHLHVNFPSDLFLLLLLMAKITNSVKFSRTSFFLGENGFDNTFWICFGTRNVYICVNISLQKKKQCEMFFYGGSSDSKE